jgi:plasmid stabilization system protein ParE
VNVIELKFLPSAEVDIDVAIAFYFERNPSIAIRLMMDVDAAIVRIRESPTQFPFVEESARRVLLRKFPFTIYYILDGATVTVIAFMHQRRHPDQWRRRRDP